MTERPILFSAPMIRALLDGRKTQTRRVLKPQPHADCGPMHVDIYHPTVIDRFGEEQPGKATFGTFSDDGAFATPIRIQRGDRLWVRESGHLLREAYDHDPRQGEDLWRDAGFQHSADGEIVSARPYDPPLREWVDDCARISRPSIHMPRWASRLTLTVTDVRVQRLQDISEEDARAEGISDGGCLNCGFSEPCGCAYPHPDARDSFSHLWQSINGPDSWQANPWVAAYTFTVERRNIDAPSQGGQPDV